MKKILFKDIKGLVQTNRASNGKSILKGSEMNDLSVIENAYLAIEGDRIVDFGSMDDLHGIADWNNLEIIDCEGKYVMPTFVDPHTHLVFAKSREEEFVYRIEGLGYEEIGKRGGGILNSARRLAEMTEDELYEAAYKRCDEVMGFGTGAVEIKSGYGLSVDAELKILRVIKRLKKNHPLTIKATFLGAHAYPAEYKENRRGYIDLIINEMLPVIGEEGLADYIDIFVERNYFSAEDADEILTAGARYGLRPKVHVNQFSISGGVEMAIKHKAVSVDHLEEMDDHQIDLIAQSNTIPTVLPSCSFFLNIPYAPARQMIDAGLPVALATDYNPGSTPSGKIPFLLSLSCIYMKLLPEEAISAATINAAAALELSDSHGSIDLGKKASLIVTKPIPSLAYMPYAFGGDHIEAVYVDGVRV